MVAPPAWLADVAASRSDPRVLAIRADAGGVPMAWRDTHLAVMPHLPALGGDGRWCWTGVHGAVRAPRGSLPVAPAVAPRGHSVFVSSRPAGVSVRTSVDHDGAVTQDLRVHGVPAVVRVAAGCAAVVTGREGVVRHLFPEVVRGCHVHGGVPRRWLPLVDELVVFDLLMELRFEHDPRIEPARRDEVWAAWTRQRAERPWRIHEYLAALRRPGAAGV